MIIIISLKLSHFKYYALSIFKIVSMWLSKETRKVIGDIFVSLSNKTEKLKYRYRSNMLFSSFLPFCILTDQESDVTSCT